MHKEMFMFAMSRKERAVNCCGLHPRYNFSNKQRKKEKKKGVDTMGKREKQITGG